mgnify:CR=1 FL=1
MFVEKMTEKQLDEILYSIFNKFEMTDGSVLKLGEFNYTSALIDGSICIVCQDAPEILSSNVDKNGKASKTFLMVQIDDFKIYTNYNDDFKNHKFAKDDKKILKPIDLNMLNKKYRRMMTKFFGKEYENAFESEELSM